MHNETCFRFAPGCWCRVMDRVRDICKGHLSARMEMLVISIHTFSSTRVTARVPVLLVSLCCVFVVSGFQPFSLSLFVDSVWSAFRHHLRL